MRWNGAIVLVLLELCIVAGAGAQDPATFGAETPPENTVSAWIRSGEPRLMAWGAYYTQKMQDRALVAELVGATRQWQELPHRDWAQDSGPSEAWDKISQQQEAEGDVLATLIEMKATLDVDVLRRLAPDFAGPVTVMVARMPPEAVQGLLMEWFHLPVGRDAWYFNHSLQRVAAAMLALHPAPGFVHDLLQETRVRLVVEVVPPGGGLMQGLSSEGGAGIALKAPRAGWPPLRWYFVRESYRGNDTGAVLIPGIDPIRYGVSTQTAGFGPSWLTNRTRGRLIAQMLGVKPAELTWGERREQMIRYQSDSQYLAEFNGILDAEEKGIAASLQSFQEKGMLLAEESRTAWPQVDVLLWDLREKPITAALPRPNRAETNLHWLKDDAMNSYSERWDGAQ
jgi:hypothetical protein